MGVYITRALQNWVNQNGFEDISIICDDEWYYDHAKTAIAYTMSKDPIVEETFKEYCRNCGLLDDFDPFILSFFHELGHYETFDIVEDNEYENDYFCKVALNMKENRTREDYFAYYDLEMEWMATAWAIKYIQLHSDEVRELELEIDIIRYFEKSLIGS